MAGGFVLFDAQTFADRVESFGLPHLQQQYGGDEANEGCDDVGKLVGEVGGTPPLGDGEA